MKWPLKTKSDLYAFLFAEPVPVRQPPHRNHVHKQSEKTTRVRTVLNEKQLHTLRTCYNANPRPDALMKEQLVEMTGLSPRVIRVWFQNKRCKDKKRSMLMKQLQQQQHNDKTVGIFCNSNDFKKSLQAGLTYKLVWVATLYSSNKVYSMVLCSTLAENPAVFILIELAVSYFGDQKRFWCYIIGFSG